ncbi:ABC-type glutathione transport system ATPase component [Catenulispora sp. MAP12-49]|uniref:ABC transporter ATP-binding protein n=1 Tax=Catenulispora sp. MAP12-49 TaxID=3156302 RepID=UPI0035115083
MTVLEIKGLTVAYDRRRPVLTDVALTVGAGEIVGVVGETGSGKTTLARAVAGLVPIRTGTISLAGTDLTALKARALRDFRRTGRLQLVFQDPLRALDPDWDVNALVAEPLAVAGAVPAGERAERVADALRAVGLDPALAARRPAQLSGGQRQRVLLARALVTAPDLVIADEPVSALDAAARNHVLALLAGLRDRSGTSQLVISHDLPSLAGLADRIAVLYRGRIVEEGPVERVLTEPSHPYTARLVAATPRLRRLRPAAV